MKEQVHFLNELVKGQDLIESLQTARKLFKVVKFSSAFGQEDQVIADAIFTHQIDIEVFTLDTGRLFKETYDLIERTRSRYQAKLKIYFPNYQKVESLVENKGVNSFYESVHNRKECCFIRKVEPLKRALKGTQVWVTGLRADQSENRQNLRKFEWDEVNEVIKFNPIIDWSFEQMMDYLKQNKVPYNELHDKGFISIGCAPCTRATLPGEHARAGRWWWESSQKECGLHQVNQKEKLQV
jgi:phosphoadenosine phosphosulfate reductase